MRHLAHPTSRRHLLRLRAVTRGAPYLRSLLAEEKQAGGPSHTSAVVSPCWPSVGGWSTGSATVERRAAAFFVWMYGGLLTGVSRALPSCRQSLCSCGRVDVWTCGRVDEVLKRDRPYLKNGSANRQSGKDAACGLFDLLQNPVDRRAGDVELLGCFLDVAFTELVGL